MIILLVVVLICGIICIKRFANTKLQMWVCLLVLVSSTLGVWIIPNEEVKLIELCVGLLSCAIFAVIYSSISDAIITNKLKEITNKIDARNTLDYFKADYIYKENDSHEPDMQLCGELTKMLSESTTYIYEGEDATSASMCMLLAADLIKNRTKPLQAHFIIRDLSKLRINQLKITDDLKKDINNIFGTLFILHHIVRDIKHIDITIYLRNSSASQYVNLTDKGVFFSPYKKTTSGYPQTCLFKKHDENANDLYQLFNKAWSNRIKQSDLRKLKLMDKNILKVMNFMAFANAGVFGDEITKIAEKNITMDTKEIRDYFTKLLEERKENYHIK